MQDSPLIILLVSLLFSYIKDVPPIVQLVVLIIGGVVGIFKIIDYIRKWQRENREQRNSER